MTSQWLSKALFSTMFSDESLYHVSHGAGVDVGVMDAAVLSVCIFPVAGTFVILAESSGFSRVCDGPDLCEHEHTFHFPSCTQRRIKTLCETQTCV